MIPTAMIGRARSRPWLPALAGRPPQKVASPHGVVSNNLDRERVLGCIAHRASDWRVLVGPCHKLAKLLGARIARRYPNLRAEPRVACRDIVIKTEHTPVITLARHLHVQLGDLNSQLRRTRGDHGGATGRQTCPEKPAGVRRRAFTPHRSRHVGIELLARRPSDPAFKATENLCSGSSVRGRAFRGI